MNEREKERESDRSVPILPSHRQMFHEKLAEKESSKLMAIDIKYNSNVSFYSLIVVVRSLSCGFIMGIEM
jgi:hypothetical protein